MNDIEKDRLQGTSFTPNKRPLSVTLVAWLFIATAAIGIVYHAKDLLQGPFDYETMWILVVRLLAIVGGVFALRGAGWARWVLILWIAYHTVLSAFHTLPELLVHSVFMVVIAYILLRRQASLYFRGGRE